MWMFVAGLYLYERQQSVEIVTTAKPARLNICGGVRHTTSPSEREREKGETAALSTFPERTSSPSSSSSRANPANRMLLFLAKLAAALPGSFTDLVVTWSKRSGGAASCLPAPDIANINPSMPGKTAARPPPKLKRIVHPSQRSILRLVWKELLSLIAAFIFLVPTWTIVIVFLPVAIIAGWCLDRFMRTCLRESYPGFRRLNPWDAVWLTQTNSDLAPVSMVLITLEGGLTFQEIKSLVLDRMILAKDDNESMMYPRFMQKVVEVAGCYAWVYDGDFDPSHHIVVLPSEISSVEVLRTHMAELAVTPIPTNKPLWMLHVRTNFGANGDTVLVYRFHQSMSDGISLVKILCRSVTDKTQEVYHIKSRFGGIQFFLNSIRSVLMASVFLVTRILFHIKADWSQPDNPFFMPRPAPSANNLGEQQQQLRNATDKMRPLRAQHVKEILWSDAIPLRVLDRISMVTRNSLHNIILTCLSGAVRSCMVAAETNGGSAGGSRNSWAPAAAAHACVPVDLRRPLSSITSAIEMGNQFVLLNVKIPTDTIGSVPRLWKIRQQEDKLKSTSDTTSMYWIVQVLGHLLPVCLIRRLLTRSVISGCVVSNVPGPDAQLCLSGKSIKSIAFWPPNLVAQNSLSVSFFTYAEKLQIGIAVDPDFCDANTFAAQFAFEVKELSGLLSNRRAPGEVKRRHSENREPLPVLRTRIIEVQRALQDAQMAIAAAPAQKDANTWNDEALRVDLLREELMAMLSAARRRKSVVEGVSFDFEEEEDIANEVRSGSSARRRASSISSSESVRVFAASPSRTSGQDRDSFSMARSITNSNIQNDAPSGPTGSTATKGKIQNATVIYITHDSDSGDSTQQV
ncbi:hypothetical protein BV898_03608 [Hypsibius exemplaris]|uniref:Uncharacterized protein n=1 Tax=Hypsibius exemplaris TaxID=2072580 RepID=A0A1W0X4F6_HYPEX|nr:hypothetical protein BV898_03608 [Hypsibius exemplaris]